MTEILNISNTDDVSFRIDTSKFNPTYLYHFKVDNQEYQVEFEKTYVHLADYLTPITNNAYAIYLSGPNFYDLTGMGKGPTVYRHLLKAVKKFIADFQPEGITFSGVNDQQNIMYAKFYDKYLKQYYTNVDESTYLRNDFLKSLKQSEPNLYAKIQQNITRRNENDPVGKLKQYKKILRQTVVKARVPGKIALDIEWARPCYVQSVSGNTATVVAFGSYATQAVTYQTPVTALRPVSEIPDKKRLDKLIDYLTKQKIPFTYL